MVEGSSAKISDLSGKKNILIIPSWYPTNKNPIVGIFFKEQAELVSNDFNIKVLNVNYIYCGYRKTLKQLFSFKISEQEYTKVNVALTPPEAINFICPLYTFHSQKRILEDKISYFRKQFSKLIDKGWVPDLLHAHCTVDAGIIATVLSKEFNIPIVLTEHQAFLLHRHSQFIQEKIFQAFEVADKVAVVSHHQMRSVLMHGIKCDPIVIGNYINENLFNYKERCEDDVFKILTITYPHYLKDIATFFKAIALLSEKGVKDFRVTMIGNDAFSDISQANVSEFEELSRQYNISGYFTFIPYVERNDLPAVYHQHDVFVSTSIAETFGVAICEAMLTGMPVVATSSGGVDDTINDKNGIKVNIRDFEAIADALVKIKKNRNLFKPLDVRNSILRKFGSEVFRNNLISLYYSAIKN